MPYNAIVSSVPKLDSVSFGTSQSGMSIDGIEPYTDE
jgi:hypothetical protein